MLSNCVQGTTVCPHDSSSPFAGVSCNIIGNIESIELSYDFAYFPGSIVSSINQLTALTKLDIEGLYLGGSLPESLFQMTSLVSLQLNYNGVGGALPLNVNMPSLVGISLAYNSLTGPIPEALFNISSLEFIDLSSNQFIGYIPSSIGNLQSLLTLSLEGTSLIGNVPTEICKLSLLEGLYLCTANQHFGYFNKFFRPYYDYITQSAYASANVDDIGCPFLQGVPKCIIEAPNGTLSRLNSASEGFGQLIPISLHQGKGFPKKKGFILFRCYL